MIFFFLIKIFTFGKQEVIKRLFKYQNLNFSIKFMLRPVLTLHIYHAKHFSLCKIYYTMKGPIQRPSSISTMLAVLFQKKINKYIIKMFHQYNRTHIRIGRPQRDLNFSNTDSHHQLSVLKEHLETANLLLATSWQYLQIISVQAHKVELVL